MNFRRIPFKFSSTDPVERQAELEKRFGLPMRNNIDVDVANPLTMRATKNESTSSPRLQHRVPIFLDGYDQPIQSSVDSVGLNDDARKKPNVRVIPIEVEGDYRPSSRHRTFSGPASMPIEPPSDNCDYSSIKRSAEDLSQRHKVKVAGGGPQIHNIPIQIEDRVLPVQNKIPNHKTKESLVNGCAPSKQPEKVSAPEKSTHTDQQPVVEPKVENTIESSMKKIENVLKELVSYESGVNNFTGSTKDKQYKYLDEMLTRCMLRLDDVDTMGDVNVRFARKSAVKKVQACIDLLESKLNVENISSSGEATGQSTDFEINGVVHPKRENTVNTDIKTEILAVEINENLEKSSVESDVCVTEVGPSDDVKVEYSEVPNIIEPNEIEMSENQLGQDTENSEISKESEIVIEEVKEDSSTESADEVPDVEMAEVDREVTEKSANVNSTLCGSYSAKQDAYMEEVVSIPENVAGNEHNEELITAEEVNVTETDLEARSASCDLSSSVKDFNSKLSDDKSSQFV